MEVFHFNHVSYCYGKGKDGTYSNLNKKLAILLKSIKGDVLYKHITFLIIHFMADH